MKNLETILTKIKSGTILILDLRNKQIDDDDAGKIAEALKGNKSVKSVDLYNNQISDAGAEKLIAAFETMPNLTVVNLFGNQNISEHLLAKIKTILKPKILEELLAEIKTGRTSTVALYNQQINDEDVARITAELKGNTSVKYIYLCNNQITDAGATTLSEALKNNKTIEDIDLSTNKFSDQGAEKLIESFKTMPKLTTALIYSNNISEETVGKIDAIVEDHKNPNKNLHPSSQTNSPPAQPPSSGSNPQSSTSTPSDNASQNIGGQTHDLKPATAKKPWRGKAILVGTPASILLSAGLIIVGALLLATPFGVPLIATGISTAAFTLVVDSALYLTRNKTETPSSPGTIVSDPKAKDQQPQQAQEQQTFKGWVASLKENTSQAWHRW